MAVYKIFYDVHDVKDHSFKLLTNSLVFDDWEDTKWLFEELRTDRSVLDLIGKKRTVAAKTIKIKNRVSLMSYLVTQFG
jgi:hypothetical protein